MSVLSRLRVPVFSAGGAPSEIGGPWELQVSGLIDRPLVLSLDKIKEMPRTEVSARLASVSRFSVRALWQGLHWRDFLAAAPPQPGASHATFVSHGGAYTTTVSLADLDHPRVLLVYAVEGEPLEREYGGPLRMVIPHLYGYKSAKWLKGIEYTDRMHGGYWEDRGYPRQAPIEPGITLDLNTRQRRAVSGGEIMDF